MMCVIYWLSCIDLDFVIGGDCLLYMFMFWDVYCYDIYRLVKKILDFFVLKFKF